MNKRSSFKFFIPTSLFAFALSLYTIGCNPVKFTGPGATKDCGKVSQAGDCIVTPSGTKHYDYDVLTTSPKVDILIVDDNSASMSFEQRHLSARFMNFINSLEARPIDYRIAITTTDISSSENPARAINGNGSRQNGNLIPFSNGSNFLTSQSGTLTSKVNMFDKAVVRSETISCESFISQWIQAHGVSGIDSQEYQNQYLINCPSGDERGIYAANKVIQNNPGGFIRSGANLAIIILSDEDERSQYYEPYYGFDGFQLEPEDTPSNLIKNVLDHYGSKSFVVHSLVVKDSTCKKQQDTQMPGGVVSGSYGNQYAKLSRLTGGVVGDICANDQIYSNQLGAIAASVAVQVQGLALNCVGAQNLKVTLSGGSNPGFDLVGLQIRFRNILAAGTKVHLSYDCP